MAQIHSPHLRFAKPWNLPERQATPESTYMRRRQVLAAMGFSALGIAGLGAATLLPPEAHAAAAKSLSDTFSGLPALEGKPNPAFKAPEPPTPEGIAAQYNNFYEFSRDKDDVWELAQKLTLKPWQVEVTGLVDKPQIFDVDDLLRKMPLEERVYRFRCVEAWSMVVPWVGFPLAALLKQVGAKSGAKYVELQTFLRPSEAPRQSLQPWLGGSEPWPYTEGLTLAEATNDLTMLAVGMYGHTLANQHGAPIRLVVPWKYGYKNIKSVVRIEVTDKRPATFWNTLVPSEYGFESNVEPGVPHPRWSQAFERDIGTRNRKPTLPYNGYEQYVGGLYKA